MNSSDLYYELAASGMWGAPVKTVDEDGFVRDIVSIAYNAESACFLLRTEIQKKNGEIE